MRLTLRGVLALTALGAAACSADSKGTTDAAIAPQPDAEASIPAGDAAVVGADAARPPDAAGPDTDAAVAPSPDAAVAPNTDAAVAPSPDAAVAPPRDAAVAPPRDAAVPPGQYNACGDVPGGATDCFSNFDCLDGQVCRNVGFPDLEVPCCLPGERGVAPPGADCAGTNGELICATGVCIIGDTGSFCSGECAVDADCPAGMQRCVSIPLGERIEGWCFPESAR